MTKFDKGVMQEMVKRYENVKAVIDELAATKNIKDYYVMFDSQIYNEKLAEFITVQDHKNQANYATADHHDGITRVNGKATSETFEMFKNFKDHEYAYRHIEDKDWKDTYEYTETVSVEQDYDDKTFQDRITVEVTHRYNKVTKRYSHTQPKYHSYSGLVHANRD
ncbi:hypothetical protein FACS1894184_21510 [Clostridia bacterium]|nr:hypothetical protein FACS1894184_21510 [Clostridia bacterium]